MTKSFSRFLAFFCCLAMLVSLMPAAFADDGGDTVVYNMQDDSAIKGKSGDAGEYTDGLQRCGTPVITIVDGEEGKKSLHITERAQGYFGVDIKADLFSDHDAIYTITVKGHLPAGVSTDNAILQATGDKVDDGQYYAWLVNKPVEAGGAFELTLTASIGDIIAANGKSLGKFQIQLQDAEKDFYIDDIIITMQAPAAEEAVAVLIEESFDNGENPFAVDGTVVVAEISGDRSVSGDNSLLVDRPSPEANWHGVVLNNDKLAEPGMQATGKYRFSARVYAESPEEPRITVRVDSVTNGSDSWGGIISKGISLIAGEWNDVVVEFTVPDNHEIVKRVSMINGSQQADLKFYVDDVKLEVLREPVEVVPPEWESGLASLHEAYADYFLFGSILEPSILSNEGTVDMFKYHYNAVTAENSMKPDAMVKRGEDGEFVFTYENADKMVEWAQENNISVVGHTLVWHAQSPSWLTRDDDGQPLTRAQAQANLKNYIDNVAGHFKGKLISWDVVNEAVSGGSNSPWKQAYANGADESLGEQGDDYIYDAFVFTRLVDADAVLYYNDFNEHLASNREEIYNMIKKFNDRWADDVRNTEPGRLLIEGVGMQAHYWTGEAISLIDNVTKAIDLYRELGVEISVSELDIPAGAAGTLKEATDEEKATQAILYAQLFELYKANADIISRVTLWGRDDASSWRGGNNGNASPLHFDSMLQAKPSFYAMLNPTEFLANIVLPEEFVPPVAYATPGTPVIGANDAAWAAAPSFDVNQKVAGDSAATAKAKLLWDNEHVYVRVEVIDAEIDVSSANAWERDSVEVFISETNVRGGYNGTEGNQYRVDADGTASHKTAAPGWGIDDAAVAYSHAERTNYGYLVEMMLPWRADAAPVDGQVIGLDIQINDPPPASGRPQITWSDPKADGYNSSISWGIVKLVNAAPIIFNDVDVSAWYAPAVQFAVTNGYTSGIGNNNFGPNRNVTRAQFIKMLCDAIGIAPIADGDNFADAGDTWYTGYLAAVKQLGISDGVGNNTFAPNREIKREELFTLLFNAMVALEILPIGNGVTIDSFADAASVSDWATSAMAYLVGNGIVTGTAGSLRPHNTATRAEMVQIFFNLLTR